MDTSPLAYCAFITLSGVYLICGVAFILAIGYVMEKRFKAYCVRHGIGQ